MRTLIILVKFRRVFAPGSLGQDINIYKVFDYFREGDGEKNMGQVKTNESKRILIVEDDLFLREMYKTKLESEDFEVVTAEDGEKGLKMALGQKIDLVLLDIVLPKKDGFEVLAELKADKVKSSLPVILLTNLAQREDVEKGLRLGADDYIIKAHFVPSEVVKKILVILSK